jgi:hypothetical protein
MEHISIKNLERYQPNYKDGRSIIWVRWDIDGIRDYKLSKLTPGQRWLFLSLICIACKHKNNLPLDYEWLSYETIYDKRYIINDIKALQEINLLVTKCDKSSQNVPTVTDSNIHTVTDIHTQDVTSFFEYFCLKTKKRFTLNQVRRDIITLRLKDHSLDQLKLAVDNFIQDDWPDRHKFIDIVYCIGTRGKVDNLEKWLNWQPKKEERRITA